MTLVACVSGYGGLVMLADSQETRQGYAKKSVQKIELHGNFRDAEFVWGIGGAGNGDHVDSLAREISSVLQPIKEYEMDAIVEAVKLRVHDYFQRNIWCRVGDKPDVELLMTLHPVCFKECRPEAFHIADGLVTYVPTGHKCIGVGSYLSDYILDTFSASEESELLAIGMYLLRAAKHNIDGVGMDGYMLMFCRNGDVYEITQTEITEFESIMARFDDLAMVLFNSAFHPRTTVYPKNIEKQVELIRQDFNKLAGSLSDIRKRWHREQMERAMRLRGGLA